MTSSSSPHVLCRSGFPPRTLALQALGLKFSGGGAHISRTMMLAELEQVLACVPRGAPQADYRAAVLDRNVLGKTTVSTRLKSMRHLRELYAMDEAVPIFGVLRKLYELDATALPLLAVQVAWSRDSVFRATTAAVLDAAQGEVVTPLILAHAVADAFPGQYSTINQDKVARNAASSWTQSGHLLGRSKKARHHVQPALVAVTLALFLGHMAGFHGAAVFSNPWCRLLELDADRARTLGQEAHRASLLTLRSVGDVVEITFPLLEEFQLPSA